MPANVYECMVILDTNKVAGDQAGAAKQLQTILERNNAEVLSQRPWAETKLAYPIKNHKKGLYFLTFFRTEGQNLTNIERDFQLNETILRSMILRVEGKLVDAMLEVGKNDYQDCLKTVNTPPDEDLGGDDDRRDRRGGRGGRGGPPPSDKESKE